MLRLSILRLEIRTFQIWGLRGKFSFENVSLLGARAPLESLEQKVKVKVTAKKYKNTVQYYLVLPNID